VKHTKATAEKPYNINEPQMILDNTDHDSNEDLVKEDEDLVEEDKDIEEVKHHLSYRMNEEDEDSIYKDPQFSLLNSIKHIKTHKGNNSKRYTLHFEDPQQ
jgi:hypothetical protein